jgi:catechol 2,3-dioxygenase-like lactoylglutathione lyase family enzyme
MPSIHPSEEPALGWLAPCLNTADLKACMAFYGKLGFVQYGGNTAEGWAMMRNRGSELHMFQGHVDKDTLNFRGCSPAAIRPAMEERGLTVDTVMGERSFQYLDPDGRPVFIDSGADEETAYQSGQPLIDEVPAEQAFGGEGLDVGNLSWCLACADLTDTMKFYETLGFVPAGGEPTAGWAILARPDHKPAPGTRVMGPYLSLFKGMIPADCLSFRGGNVDAIAAAVKALGVDLGKGVQTAPDGAESLALTDPDGRTVLFDTGVAERLYDEA